MYSKEVLKTIPSDGRGLIYCYVVDSKKGTKTYVGQTTQPIRLRHKTHKASTLAVDYAIRKYNYTLFILEECDIDLLNTKEKEYIEMFHSDEWRYGYNHTEGGTNIKGSHYSIDVYDLDWNLIYSFASVKKCAKFLKMSNSSIYEALRENKILMGKYHICSINPKMKSSIAHCKKIMSYKDGIYTEYNSIKSAHDATGTNKKSIYLCCIKEQRSANGYFWCYAEDVYSDWFQNHIISLPKSITPSPTSGIRRAVCMYHNDFVTIYSSLNEAGATLGISSKGIGRVCSGQRKKYKGLNWAYA